MEKLRMCFLLNGLAPRKIDTSAIVVFVRMYKSCDKITKSVDFIIIEIYNFIKKIPTKIGETI